MGILTYKKSTFGIPHLIEGNEWSLMDLYLLLM